MAQCSPSELLDASSAYGGLTGPMLELIKTSLLCQILQETNPMADCSPQSLLDAAACFNCYIAQLPLIQTQLLCEILHAGGSSTDTCLTCGSGAPIADATCDCSIYYDSDSGSPTVGMMWVWDGTAWFNISDLGSP